jgi:hypothetical protein
MLSAHNVSTHRALHRAIHPTKPFYPLCNRARSTHLPVTRRYLPVIQPITQSPHPAQCHSSHFLPRLSHLVFQYMLRSVLSYGWGSTGPLRQTRYSPGYFASAAPRPPHLTLTDDRIWLHMLSADNVSHPPCSSLFHSPDQTARPTYSATVLARLTHPSPVATYPFIQPFTASRSVSQFTSTLHRIAHRLSHLVSVHAAFCSVLWMGINRPLRLAIRQGTSPPPPPSPAAPNPYRRPYLASYAQC